MLSEPLLEYEIGSPPGAGTSDFRSADAHAERVAAAGKARKELGGRLLCVGFMLRLLTVLNGVALCVGVAYYVYCSKIIEQLDDLEDVSDPVDLLDRIRVAITCALPFLAGLGLLLLEWQSCCAEKAARKAIGCAFGPGGRCYLLLLSALVMVPLVHLDHGAPPDRRLALVPEWWVTAGAAAFTLLSALLQAWLLSCAPDFRTETVADFEAASKNKLLVDASAFPQVYRACPGRLPPGLP